MGTMLALGCGLGSASGSGGGGGGGGSITAPMAFWRLEDLTDSVGAISNLTNTGSTTFTAGKIGNAATLNGSSKYLSHADTALLRANGSISIAVWIKIVSGPIQRIVAKWTVDPTREFTLEANSVSAGQPFDISWDLYNTSATNASLSHCLTGLVSNTWNFVVVTFDTSKTAPNNMGCSLNGAALSYPNASNSITAVRADSAGIFNIGNDGFGNFVNGQIDALGWWNNYALTSAEVAALYNSGAGKEYVSGAWV